MKPYVSKAILVGGGFVGVGARGHETRTTT